MIKKERKWYRFGNKEENKDELKVSLSTIYEGPGTWLTKNIHIYIWSNVDLNGKIKLLLMIEITPRGWLYNNQSVK